MNGKLKWLMVFAISLFLSGCGGGGGGGGVVTTASTATLTGTITDTTLAPVDGATVRVNNGAAFTTNAAGRYTITGLPGSTPLRLSYAGPNAEFFPAGATVTLTRGKTTVLDLFLARATGQTVDASLGGIVTSEVYLDPGDFAAYNLTASELQDGAGLYGGLATVYLAPINVGKPGHGLASFQASLNALFPALAASAAILETYGSAGLTINNAAGTALSLVASPTSTLTIPIPIDPPELRISGPATADLWRFDTATATWLHSAGETATRVGDTYVGEVSSPGLWRVADQRTLVDLTEITGTLRYSNGTAVGGATIYLNGTDHGFQSVATTSATGAFALAAKTDGDFDLNFVVWANGAQWPHKEIRTINDHTIENLSSTNASLGNVTFPYAPPVAGAAATATIKIDSRPAGNIAPNTMGYLLAGGRQIHGEEDPLAVEQIADVVFLANEAPAIYGAVTLTPNQNVLGRDSGVQVVAGTFAGMTSAPTTDYVYSTNPDPATWTINLATTPVLVAVKTGQGHFAKISIDAVTPVGLTGWQITFRHAFSLSGNF